MADPTEAKLAVLESRLDRIERALENIANSLAILARVEVQNAALTATVLEHGQAIAAIKEEMPSLKLVRYGAGALVVGILAAVGTAVLKLVGLGGAA